MIVEILLATIVAFGFGSWAGKKQGIEETEQKRIILPARAPDVWPPVDHQKLLKTCGIMCGEGNLRGYNAIYGKCECKEGK